MELHGTVRRGYDALGDAYARRRGGEDHLDRLLEGLEQPRVLDAGCGPGTPGMERVERAVGLDLSREQLRLAGERLPAAARVQGVLGELPFRDGSFDAVAACNSLIHVPREDHPAVLAEFARVLRPGGRLMLTEGTDPWEGENPDWMGSGVTMAWSIAGREATVAALEAAGFTPLAEWVVGDDTAEDDDARTPYFLARLG
jgi:SAM-dependent methyltransferase